MRKPTVKNKYKLKISDIKKLKVNDWSKVCEPLFWKNTVVNAWCWSHVIEHGQYETNSCWLGIYDNGKIKISFTSYDGMCGYDFKKFFDYTDIEIEDDLLIQEIFLDKINYLLDNKILCKETKK